MKSDKTNDVEKVIKDRVGVDEDGLYVMVNNTNTGEQEKRYPDKDIINFNKAVSLSKKYQEEKSGYKKSYLEEKEVRSETEKKYNKVYEEYSAFKEKNKGLDDQIKNLRINIEKEVTDKYESKFKEQEEYINKAKQEKKEAMLLSSDKLINGTSLPKTALLKMFGEYMLDDGTYLDLSGQVIHSDNRKDDDGKYLPSKSFDKFIDTHLKTHPDRDRFLLEKVKSGNGVTNDKSPDRNTIYSEAPKITGANAMKDLEKRNELKKERGLL